MPAFTKLLQSRGLNINPVTNAADSPARNHRRLHHMEEAYIVDNSQLRSTSPSGGIRFRRLPDTREVAWEEQPVAFGSTVRGILFADSWLKVGEWFLPITIDGATVLQKAAWLVDEENQEAESHRSGTGKEQESIPFSASPQPPKQQTQRRPPISTNLRLPEVFRPPEMVPEEGVGAEFEVLGERVICRSGPSQGGAVLGFVKRGTVVRLFQWDESAKWRKCWDDKIGWGWVLLHHPDWGPLLKPLGAKLCKTPLPPLCLAAAEGDAAEVSRFLESGMDPQTLDPEGRTPLVLAALAGDVLCIALLACAQSGSSTVGSQAQQSSHNGGSTTSQERSQAAGKVARKHLRSAAAAVHRARREGAPLPGRTVSAENLAAAEAMLFALSGMIFDEANLQAALARLPADLQEQIQSMLEAQPLQEPQPQQGLEAPFAQEPIKYEVAYPSVWIRRSPSTQSESLTKRLKGDHLAVLELTRSEDDGLWGRVQVVTQEGKCEGWMLLRHPQLGDLLHPLCDFETTVG